MKRKPQITKKALKIIEQNQSISVAKTKDLIFDTLNEYYHDATIRKEKRKLKENVYDTLQKQKKIHSKKLLKLLKRTFEIEKELINV